MSGFVKGKKTLSFSAASSLWVILWEWYQNGLLSYFYGKNPWASSFLIRLAWCQANIKHCIFDSVFSIVPVAPGEGSHLVVLLTVLPHWLCCEQCWLTFSCVFQLHWGKIFLIQFRDFISHYTSSHGCELTLTPQLWEFIPTPCYIHYRFNCTYKADPWNYTDSYKQSGLKVTLLSKKKIEEVKVRRK